MTSRRRLLGMAVVPLALVTGCSGGARHADEVFPFPTPPSYAELVQKAQLDPCPAASGTSTVSKGLPDITLPCLGDGPKVRLAALRGTPTVVNIWGTWCTPCQRETTFLSQVYDETKPRVRFLGVDTEDDAKSALDFAPHVQPPMHYPQVFDADKKLLLALHLQAVPATVFLSADGRVVHVERDYYRSVAALRSDLRRYLGISA